MNRTTISNHQLDYTTGHLDIFFETPNYLETYEAGFEKFAELTQQRKILCSKKKPHRKLYLDYEGNLSNDRGFLKILWTGFYENNSNSFPEQIKISLVENNKLSLEF